MTAAGGLPKRGLGGVSRTRTRRSLSIEISLRSFDSVVRIVRSQPMASALSRLPRGQGTVVGSGRTSVSVRTAAQTDAGRGSATERADQGSDASQSRFGVRERSPRRSRAAFRTMPPNTPRAAGRGAAGADARRKRRLRCYARRDFGPPGEGHAAEGRFGHRVIDRRTFLGTLAGALLAAPLGAEAQPVAKTARVGVLLNARWPPRNRAVIATRQATGTIPIVFVGHSIPRESDCREPRQTHRNVTGLTMDVAGKRPGSGAPPGSGAQGFVWPLFEPTTSGAY
jgi:hypothetical protein